MIASQQVVSYTVADEKLFNDTAKKFGLSFTPSDKAFRLKIFIADKIKVDNFNKSKDTYQGEVNLFSFLTEQEIKARLGFGRDGTDNQQEYQEKNKTKSKEAAEAYKNFINTQLQNTLVRLKEEQRLEAVRKSSESTTPIVTATNPFKAGTLFHKMFALGPAYLDVDWRARGKVTPVRNQGNCGSCWAFSALGALEAGYLVDSNVSFDLSEQELVHCSPFNCDGGWMTQAFQYIKAQGIHLETSYPYTATNGTCTASTITQPKKNFHEVINMTSKDMYVFLTKLAVKPLTVAYTVKGTFTSYKTGILDANRLCTGKEAVNHAVLAVGYKIDTVTPANSYILFKNSWGSTWGDAGYFKFKLYNTIATNGPCGMLRYGDVNYYVNTIIPA